jgi:hypothetical protein
MYFFHGRNIRFANAEHAIPVLPGKFTRPLPPHPFRRIRLHYPHNLRGRMHGPNPQQHVNMITRTVDDDRSPLHLADDPSEISKQISPKLRLDQGPSPQRRENKMKQDVSRCMRQASSAPPGLLPSSQAHPRLAPWAALFRRFAASPPQIPAVLSPSPCVTRSLSRSRALRVCDNRHKVSPKSSRESRNGTQAQLRRSERMQPTAQAMDTPAHLPNQSG